MSKKILFITYKLQKYRIPIFDIIGDNPGIDLTIMHSGKHSGHNSGKFKELKVEYKSIGRFTYYNSEFSNLVNEYDVVVCMFYLQNLSFLKLALSKKRKFKLIFWGIGVRASYESNFDTPTVINRLRYFMARKSDAMIFYTDYAREKYIKQNIDLNKLFVMHNTVEVKYEDSQQLRDKILFVGSLYKEKKIFELLNAYVLALEKTKQLYQLHIVGNGEEYDRISHWIKEKGLKESIILHGAIYDEKVLGNLFSTSIACVSPGQAGLSVLKSFGYGCPFITHRNAITGGERLNIQNDDNGILFKDYDELELILIETALNKDKYLTMGNNALLYYKKNRTPNIMAKGFLDAINYVF